MKDTVCVDCGIPFLTEAQKHDVTTVTTFHIGDCVVCGVEKSVTHIRHYNYLQKPKPLEK